MSAPALRGGTWSQALVELGFTAHGAIWTRDELQATLQGGWIVLRVPAPGRDLDPLLADADRPGLWRLVRAAGGGFAWVFELPPTLVARVESSPDEHATALAVLAWALRSAPLQQHSATRQQHSATRQQHSAARQQHSAALERSATLQRGPGSAGLQPGSPASRSVSAAAPRSSPSAPSESIVRSGAVVAQIHASRDGSVLELPLTTRSTASLDAGRAAWMRALLRESRSRWRLARSLLVDGVPSARVDLRGAPPEIQDDLTVAVLDALRQVGTWLLEPLDVVLDPSLDSPALAAGAPAPVRSPRRARPAPTRRARPASSQENHDGSLDDSAL